MIVESRGNRLRMFLAVATVAVLIAASTIARAEDVEKLKAGIVKITTHINERRSVGTGFIIRLDTRSAFIVTASHVIEGDPEPPQVTFATDSARAFSAKVVQMEGGDPAGLAVLVVESELPAGLRALAIDATSEVKSGDPVTVIGCPQGLATPWTVADGQISGFKGRFITFQAPIEEGNSGGPLLRYGKVVGVVTEKREAFGYAASAVVAQQTLNGWGVEPKAELESAVRLSGMLSNQGWIITISIAEPAKEIFYGIGDEPAFKSTGFSDNIDQRTGSAMPIQYLTVATDRVPAALPIYVKYLDRRGRENGPYALTFDPHAERLKEAKNILQNLTADSWLSFRFYSGELLVYFTHLLSYRDVVKEIRYSVDDHTLSQRFPFKPWAGVGNPDIDSDTTVSLTVPMKTSFVDVKLAYVDGSESEMKTFRKPSGMAGDEGVDELKKRLASNPGLAKAKDDDGKTALHRAAEEGHAGEAEALLAAGAAVDARDEDRKTPLHIAAEEGHEAHKAVAEMLLAHGADANAKDQADDAPLHFAAASGNRSLVEALITHHADVNAAGHDGYTPLHKAASKGVAEALLAAHAQVDGRNTYEQTPLYRAADDGRVDVAEVLLANKASIDAKDNSEETPLYAAAEEGHVEMVRFLLQHGANPNLADDRGKTPLHVAVEKAHGDVVEALVAGKADVNARTEDQETPLHLAAMAGYRDMVELLLASKADPRLKDREGRTALDLAVTEKAMDVADVLRQRLAPTQK